MNIHTVPDELKVGMSVSPPALYLFGVPVQEWTYVLSMVVSILFIIEKSPNVYKKVKSWLEKRKNGTKE